MISEHEFQQIGEKSSVELMFAMMAYKTQLQNSLKEILTQSEICLLYTSDAADD